jgi:hypothetical protein
VGCCTPLRVGQSLLEVACIAQQSRHVALMLGPGRIEQRFYLVNFRLGFCVKAAAA